MDGTYWLRENDGIWDWDNLSLIAGSSKLGKSEKGEDENSRARFAAIVQ